jgi:hypothetical protein
MTRRHRPPPTRFTTTVSKHTNDHTKGTTVKPTEPAAKPASTQKTGLRALLGGLLHARGSGAPAFGGARNRGVLLVALVAALGALLAVSAAPAFAFETRLFEEGFGPDGTTTSEFLYPWSLAVDQSTGNLYAGSAEGVVRKFAPPHSHELFSGAVPPGDLGGFGNFGQIHQIAVNSRTTGAAAHDLYVLGENGAVSVYSAAGKPVDFTAGPFSGTSEITGLALCGVAVDQSGDVYVSEFGTGVRVYSESGELLTTISSPGVCQLAVATSGVVYGNVLKGPEAQQSGPVVKFTPSAPPPVTALTMYEANGTVDGNGTLTVAVDPSDDHLFADEGGQVAEYGAGGEPLAVFGPGGPGALVGSAGVAVDGASGALYVSNTQGGTRQVYTYGPVVVQPDVSTGKASEITPKGSVKLTGKVKPDGVALTECEFEYVEEARYQAGSSEPYATGAVAPCAPVAETIPTSGETEVTVEVKGLKPGATYDYRLRASNKTASNKNPANFGANETVVFPPLPAIEAASTGGLTSSSAELSVKIDPGSLATTYHFEYDIRPYASGEPEGAHGRSVGAGEVAANAGSTPIGPVKIPLEEAGKTYYWRVVATNAAGTTVGVDHTFVYDTSEEGLPDHRAYEMVTSPQKNGALVGDVFLGVPPDVAESGSRVMLTSIQCFAGAESCTANRQLEGEPVLFTRTGAGWVAKALTPPGRLETNTYWMPGAEGGAALFSAVTEPMLEDDFYVRSEGSFMDIGPSTPPAEGALGYEPWVLGKKVATSDFSRLVYEAESPLWPPKEGGGREVYEYSGTGNAAPVFVGVSGGLSSTDLISACGTSLAPTPGTLSSDGETVYFTAAHCSSGTGANSGRAVPASEVFARVGESRTVAISEPAAFGAAAPYPGCEAQSCIGDVNETANWREAVFVGGSVDGSKVFFLSSQKLTDDASATEPNLYAYDWASSPGHLLDVSAGDTSGHGARVQGVAAISADGSHIYFVARGVLTGAANGVGQTARDGVNNLYVFARDAEHPQGAIAFVTQLPEADNTLWQRIVDSGEANVTPDGRFLVFGSHAALTSDDTRTDGAAQIFRYDALTGALVRVSIGQSGYNDNGNAGVGDARIAAAALGWVGAGPSRSDPSMSHDGSFIFFESPIGLTRHALNDVPVSGTGETSAYAENVYEWHEGQVHLISDGKDTAAFGGGSTSAVKLVGSDATGSNVFFTTSDPLVAQDTDTQIDFYDARICEPERGNPCVSQPPSPLPPCSGEECHGTPAEALRVPAAPTTTFDGQGNIAEPTTGAGGSTSLAKKKRAVKCTKGRRRVKGKCRAVGSKGKKSKGRKSSKSKSRGGSHR